MDKNEPVARKKERKLKHRTTLLIQPDRTYELLSKTYKPTSF